MNESTSVLEINNLSYAYRSDFSFKKVVALKDLSLSVKKGECFGFLGLNGAGKTTTIKCILGLIKPTTGSISIDGLPQTTTLSRTRLGYVPEQPYFYDNLTVLETMKFYATLARVPRAIRDDAITAALQRVKLVGRDTFKIRALSKGLTQRLAMAQALLGTPRMLILDEPFSGLDPLGRQEFRDLFFQLKSEGTTLFICSHVLSDIEFLCDRAAILARGELRGIVDLTKRDEVGNYAFEVVFHEKEPCAEALVGTHGTIERTTFFTRVICDSRSDAEAVTRSVLQSAQAEMNLFRFTPPKLEEIFSKLVKE